MNSKSAFNNSTKVIISVVLGLLSLLFSPYGINVILDNVTIDIPWSLAFPIISAIAFGWQYGVIAGVSGGAFFPFFLWSNNGWANLFTSISFIIIYGLSGLLKDLQYFKKIQRLPFRILLINIFSILLISYYYIFHFNNVLALNPPFWVNNTIKELPIEIIYTFVIKDSFNIIFLILVSETLLKLPIIRRIFGLPNHNHMQSNNFIFVFSIITSLLIWLVFAVLGYALLKEIHSINNQHNSLALLVILTSGILVSRMLIYYSETQFKIQSDLNISEKLYRELFESNKDGISIFKVDQNGKLSNFLEMNEATGAMLGYTKKELLGINPAEIEIGVTEEKLAMRIYDLQTKGFSSFETIIRHKNGSFVNVEISVLLINYHDSPALMNITRDITERKHSEQELILAKQRAEESDRLKSAFLANMSHEIRTPMNGILGFASLLKTPELSGKDQMDYINIIEKSGNRMLNIINDIVDISKIESGLMKLDIKESNINEQLEYIYTFFKPEVESKGINFTLNNSLPSSESMIETDREKLYAILTNLIKNAIKFTEKGSIEFGYELNKEVFPNELRFYIKDTGMGIPINRQKAIFERFIQADIADKKALQGAGLGLSISKAYIEMLGGKIWVESEEGVGSTFYFTLPYQTKISTDSLVSELNTEEKSDIFKKIKIMIAEDDKVSELLLELEVKPFCKELLKVTNGVEAVNTSQNNPDIDLILMDIQMPEMGGYEATQEIRKFNKNVIIIAQTAYGLTSDREKSLESGCNDHITKPIKKEVLKSLILKYFGNN